MSINHFLNKIKGKSDVDTTTLMCLLVIVLVGLGSFGLGRLSVHDNLRNDEIQLQDKNADIVKEAIGNSSEANSIQDNSISESKMYVASKNGKLYYGVDCSGAKRIAEKNRLWFATREDASKAGYEPASCK